MTWQEFAPVELNGDPISSGIYADLVGSDPLEVADGDAAYVETYLASGQPETMKRATFRLSPTPGGTFTRVKVAVESRAMEGLPSVVLSVSTPLRDSPVDVAYMPEASTAYERHEVDIDFAAFPGMGLPWMTPDVVMSAPYWLLSSTTVAGQERTVRTTWLRVYGFGGYIPLRWRNRNDRFGGAHAARSVSTYQATNRARGTL